MNVHLINNQKLSFGPDSETFEVPEDNRKLVPTFARNLIARGYDPETKITVHREGNVVWNPTALRVWASLWAGR